MGVIGRPTGRSGGFVHQDFMLVSRTHSGLREGKSQRRQYDHVERKRVWWDFRPRCGNVQLKREMLATAGRGGWGKIATT